MIINMVRMIKMLKRKSCMIKVVNTSSDSNTTIKTEKLHILTQVNICMKKARKEKAMSVSFYHTFKQMRKVI